MVLDGGAAKTDLVLELARAEDVVPGQSHVPVDAAGLADSDPRAKRDEGCLLVAGNAIDEESGVLQGLTSAVDLGRREEGRVGGVHEASGAVRAVGFEPGHDRRGRAGNRRGVVASFAPWQVVPVGGGRSHQRLDIVLRDRPPPFEIDVGHPERRRQGLRGIDLAGHLEPKARVGAQVRVTTRVDEDPSHDTTQAGLGGDDDRLDPAVLDLGTLQHRVKQDLDAGFAGQALPDDLEVLGEVGHPGARSVGVGAPQDRPERSRRSTTSSPMPPTTFLGSSPGVQKP